MRMCLGSLIPFIEGGLQLLDAVVGARESIIDRLKPRRIINERPHFVELSRRLSEAAHGFLRLHMVPFGAFDRFSCSNFFPEHRLGRAIPYIGLRSVRTVRFVTNIVGGVFVFFRPLLGCAPYFLLTQPVFLVLPDPFVKVLLYLLRFGAEIVDLVAQSFGVIFKNLGQVGIFRDAGLLCLAIYAIRFFFELLPFAA